MKRTLVLVVLVNGMLAMVWAGLPKVGANDGRSMPTGQMVPPLHQSAMHAVVVGRSPALPWLGLEQLSPTERANARIHIEPGTAGADDAIREVERLWNSGEHDAALAQFRGLAGSFDLRHAFVVINWRTPVPTIGTDPGPNVRVGNRDSAYCTAFDRNSVNGNLLVSLLRHAGARTYLDTYLSTDSGSTWNETVNGYWSSSPGDLDGVCCGTSFFVAYAYPPENQVLCLRFDASNGQMIQFPSGTYADTVFRSAPDTVTEISMCAAEEQWPGQNVFAFARTTGDSLLFAWAPGTGQPWTGYGTAFGRCAGMLDCAINTGYSTGGNWIWVSWIRHFRPDVLCPAFAWLDDSTTTWHCYMETLQTMVSYGATSVAAWHDTVFMAYTHDDGNRFYTKGVLTCDGCAHVYQRNVPDTLAKREMPDMTGAHGDGLAVVQREYAGANRPIIYTHARYDATGWSPQNTISDYSADWVEKPRIQWIAPGAYGAVYVTWGGSAYNSVWFSHTDWNGIAEEHSTQPAAFGLRALARPEGAMLAFSNPAAGNVRLRVLDEAGRMVLSRHVFLDRGPQSLEFSSPTAGVYFAELVAAGRTATAKFVLVR